MATLIAAYVPSTSTISVCSSPSHDRPLRHFQLGAVTISTRTCSSFSPIFLDPSHRLYQLFDSYTGISLIGAAALPDEHTERFSSGMVRIGDRRRDRRMEWSITHGIDVLNAKVLALLIPSVGPAVPICGGIVAWAYLSAATRLGRRRPFRVRNLHRLSRRRGLRRRQDLHRPARSVRCTDQGRPRRRATWQRDRIAGQQRLCIRRRLFSGL